MTGDLLPVKRIFGSTYQRICITPLLINYFRGKNDL